MGDENRMQPDPLFSWSAEASNCFGVFSPADEPSELRVGRWRREQVLPQTNAERIKISVAFFASI